MFKAGENVPPRSIRNRTILVDYRSSQWQIRAIKVGRWLLPVSLAQISNGLSEA